ncbi:hypothetical protein [Luteolibacter sp. Populi]|uniref:hypothetical protein n=1 Tax=Luteolibacter sp. Populi TaxID=3230487 RepID=UPI003467D1E5
MERPPLLKTARVMVSAEGNSVFTANTPDQADAIMADLGTMPASAARDGAMASVISRLAEKDPSHARMLLAGWKDGRIEAWTDAAEKVARAIAKSDPASGPAFIRDEIPAALQVDVWGAFLAMLPAAERPALLDTLPESHSKLRMAADLLAVWLPADPAAAAEWLDRFAADKDPDELTTLGEPMRIIDANSKDPLLWLAAFHSAETPRARRFFAEGALKRANATQGEAWRFDFDAVIPDLAKAEEPSPWRGDPAAWAGQLATGDASALAPEAARELFRDWGQKQPRKALLWGLENSRPEAAEALEQLFYQDAREALEMAPQLPEGKDRDDSLVTICEMAAHFGDAASVEGFLPLISDAKRREDSRRNAAGRLKK